MNGLIVATAPLATAAVGMGRGALTQSTSSWAGRPACNPDEPGLPIEGEHGLVSKSAPAVRGGDSACRTPGRRTRMQTLATAHRHTRPSVPDRKETTVRTIINSTYVTLDGVIQNPQDWPSTGGFSDEGTHVQTELLERCDAVLLGRHTYDSFAPVWSSRSGDPSATA
jgi:hypothetical protein